MTTGDRWLEDVADLDGDLPDELLARIRQAANTVMHFVGSAVTPQDIEAVMVLSWALGRVAHMAGVPRATLERLINRAYDTSVEHQKAANAGSN